MARGADGRTFPGDKHMLFSGSIHKIRFWCTFGCNSPPSSSFYIQVTDLLQLSTIMQNENGENVDLYIPRKCSWTNRLIRAKDHGSVQINVANVDPVTGLYTGETTAYCLSGYIRDKSEGDMALTALVEANDKKDAAS